MAKKFSCGDVMAGCGWSATEASKQELFKKIAEHQKKTATSLQFRTMSSKR